MIGDENDFAELAELLRENDRPHAGHFSWESDRAVAEIGVVNEFEIALALDDQLFFSEPKHRGTDNDPPDCEAKGSGGGRVGIEVTELVDSASAAAARAGDHYEWVDWKGKLIPRLEKILRKKDNPRDLKDSPYGEYVVLIYTDEPWLELNYISAVLLQHQFKNFKLITRAYLLVSYDPHLKRYPLYRLNVVAAT